MATMKDCMLEQADTMRMVAAHFPEEAERVLKTVGREFERIYLIGSGSSLNAAYAAQYQFQMKNDAEVQVVTPFNFLHYFPRHRINEKTLVLGVSQTARSTGTIDAVELSKSLGAKTVFVTAEPDAKGAACAHEILNTWTGEELVGAKTKGFTSTIAALCYLASGLGGTVFFLDSVPEYFEETLRRTAALMPQITELVLPAPSVTILSYGPAMGIAKESALKVKETVRVPVEAYDVEEYMHGPYHCLDEHSWLIFLAPAGAGQERAGTLIRFAEQITKHILVVCNDAFAASGFESLTLALPDFEDPMRSSMAYVVPMQWTANDVTLRKGRKPEASRYPNFHKDLGSKFMPKVNYYTGT